MQYQFCDYFYPTNYFYFIVSTSSELDNSQHYQMAVIQNFPEKNTQLIEKFVQELKSRHENSYIKQWTIQEDQKLLLLGKHCQNWKQLSTQFQQKSPKVCRRRYKKLLKKQIKWPEQDEETIKYLRQVQNKSWIQIQSVLKKYKAKKIRERYKNYLQVCVNRKRWSLDQDLELWKSIQQNGKQWKQISKKFPQRSNLQLRNRYYKFLEPAFNKIKIQTKEDLGQKIQKQ